jgi:thymidine phosphorylase
LTGKALADTLRRLSRSPLPHECCRAHPEKRDGFALVEAEIAFLIKGYTAGRIPDYQMAAFCMAVFHRGMAADETLCLTRAMQQSGSVLDFSSLPGLKLDKHSTGGVGDKTSLIIAPLVAAAGAYVPMISGRGLGFTGGTLDKLEAIPRIQGSASSAAIQGRAGTSGLRHDWAV